jgi:hypothetical protein
MMSRKHYVGIASAFAQAMAENEDANARAALAGAMVNVAAFMKRDNERFDAARFFEACSVGWA